MTRQTRSDPPDDPEDGEDGEGGPPRRPSAWMWIGIIVGVVGLALAVSFVVGTDAREPPISAGDHTEFCAHAVKYRDIFGGAWDPSQDPDRMRVLATTMRDISKVSPEVVKGAADDYASGLSDAARKLDIVIAKFGKGSADAIDPAIAVLQQVGAEKEASIARLSSYIDRACHITLSPPPMSPDDTVPTTVAPTRSGTAPDVAPSVPGTATAVPATAGPLVP